MSGLGKTHISNMLRESGGWFHYSIDYRIGTRYMGEHIVDNFKREAMRNPFLRDLLLSDSIYIASNITFDNLAPLSTYLGKPGDPAKGGLSFSEYLRRQELHRAAEVSALLDTMHFIAAPRSFTATTTSSAIPAGRSARWSTPTTPGRGADRAGREPASGLDRGSEAHTEELIRRFDRAPKPMYYQREFLERAWADYLAETGQAEDAVDPDAFVRWTYARALAHRQPRYEAMAENWGITVAAEDVAEVRTAEGFDRLIARALEAKG
jgi:hypothetical protein